jgi:mannonate dehydratase
MDTDDLPGLDRELDEEKAKKYPFQRAYLPTARRKDGGVRDR